jgi:cell fate regulator YaaT (PSP1 superfamily)
MIVKFFNWDQPKNVFSDIKDLKSADTVVVNHKWGGSFLAEILVPDKSIENEEPVGQVIRKATSQDWETALNNTNREKEKLKEIKKEVRNKEIPMKVIEVRISLDGGCMLIVFAADGRIDFRNLVRDFSNKYQKIVRFQQIGSRDEARNVGGYGICGREMCCRKFPGILKSISTDMAKKQMIAHRGSERLSGLCGRLMCCLAFEADLYKEQEEKKEENGAENKEKKMESNKEREIKN